MNLKALFNFKERNYGAYVTFALGILMIITGIVYIANFQSNFINLEAEIEYDAVVPTLLMVGGILSIGMGLFEKTTKYAAYVAGVFMLTAFCLFVLNVYMFVANCFIGIDNTMEEFRNSLFMGPFVIMIIDFILAIVACFLPQVKAKKANEECACGHCNCEEEKKEETCNG